jgi:hypothetical protein
MDGIALMHSCSKRLLFFFLISNDSYIKSVEGRNSSTHKVYKRTPKERKEDEENKKTGKNPRNPKPKTHKNIAPPKQLPNRPKKTHHPTQQLQNPALPLMSCAFLAWQPNTNRDTTTTKLTHTPQGPNQ